ncbi:MAG: lyase family protein [Pseudomonadota bacterium]
MTSGPFGSALYADLWGDAEVGKLFTDSAELRAMLVVEGALAEVQAALGLIPSEAAKAIKTAAFEVTLDPAALAAGTGKSAVPVPAMVEAFRKAMGNDTASAWAHYGATSQDIADTGLALRLRQVLTIYESRLKAAIVSCADLAEAHADLPMAARTYGQAATPTSFGAIAAAWGRPMLALLDELPQIRTAVTRVSLGGAAGTLSAMGDKGPAVRAALAKALDLADPQASWHADRSGITGLGAWITRCAAALGKIGEDCLLLTHSTAGELRLGATGGSSTMPQKTNPVEPSQIVALARFVQAQNVALQGAGLHREQRDGAAWMTEWLTLPGLVLGGARAIGLAGPMIAGLTPVADRMLANLDDGSGLIFAEALSFRLAQSMPRPDAQAAVKALATQARDTGRSLADLASAAHPGIAQEDIFDANAQLGTAPAEARAFANVVRAL